MDKKSKYLIGGFVLICALSAYFGYRTFFIERNFVVENTTECNPSIEICFIWCEEKCEENYYKKISKKAYNISLCEDSLECKALICEPGEIDCKITYCSEDTVEKNEICTNP